jgi:hypothetical protein
MSTYTVLVTEPTRANKWQRAIGTTIVPVKTPLPMNVTVTVGKKLVQKAIYEVDVHALTPEQQGGLVGQKAKEWECSIDEARSMLYQMGLGVQADHCQAAPPPNAMRQTRRGEFEITAADNHDTCKSCSAPIVWKKLSPGRFMPLSVGSIEQDAGGRRFATSHFADCPHADKHRRKGK